MLDLLCFLVGRVLAAGVAELGHFKTAGGDLFVLGGGIVAVFAVGTLQGDDFAHYRCSYRGRPLRPASSLPYELAQTMGLPT
jgi:hypothetical protein